MADSNLDYRIPLATFLATAVSDATWFDVIQKLKNDEPGKEAAASDIDEAGGQLWSNLVDDSWLEQYRIHEGAGLVSVDTTNATPIVTAIDTLTADGNAAYIRITVTARDTTTDGNVLEASFGGTYYRTGGAVLVANPITNVTIAGFTTASAAIGVSGDIVQVTLTGEAATNISWDITIDADRRLR